MQTFLISTTTVALAEIGDKTQLLSLILAAKYRKPWPIVLGILAATLANHAIAGSVGALVASYLTPEVVKWVTAISFFSVALWTLKPDSADDEETARGARYGVFVGYNSFNHTEDDRWMLLGWNWEQDCFVVEEGVKEITVVGYRVILRENQG